ncbi:hypothetical protein [Piscinibacter sp. XHJ-5]|uniref:hypothetical protein n=1 Tax=Piscinibacter sp. XHJ-5 TaxID=3037797 RepID=UPI0024535480|nr:hypothetical protein [Piscinibacter sp. XHJ-5]
MSNTITVPIPAALRSGERSRFMTALWAALSVIGQARGRNALRQLADRVEGTRPDFAAQLRRSAQRGWND